MLQRAAPWRLLAIVGGLFLLVLYLYGLDRMGLYSADEPRYASIGREMALSGDYITPRLWGAGWFEKPPLLYWLVAAGFRAGLSADLAPRVPVALFSVAFLLAFFLLLRREFGVTAAAYATMILATAGMWITYSQVAITDLPMSALFGLSLLCTLPWLRTGDSRWLGGVAVTLGLAVLAKSGPPLILSLPVLWFGRHRWRDWFRPRPLLLFLAIAIPWHVACYLRNGMPFLHMLFVQQQFQRFISPGLQHVQPWWFYWWLPAALFPWTAILALLFRRSLYSDQRLRFLLVTVIWSFVFFSASTNKLYGYMLPLLPPLAILAGVALEKVQVAGRVVVALSALACGIFPLLVKLLPVLMSKGSYSIASAMMWPAIVALCAATAIFFIRNCLVSVALVALFAGSGYLWIKVETFPAIDAVATARPVARQIRSAQVPVCVDPFVPRDWRYGLNYYTETPLPDCGKKPAHGGFVYYRDHRLTLELP